MADKQISKLPGALQTTVLKNFFESTVEQLFSKSNIETISAYIGRKEPEQYDSARDHYISEPTPSRQKYSLEPVVNTIDVTSGQATNVLFYEDFVNQIKSYGVDTKNENVLFDTNFYSFLPPVNYDKLINYQEYFWSPEGPNKIAVSGTAQATINILKDVIGKKFYTSPNGVVFKNGAVVEFEGTHVIPATYLNNRYIVEGVGESIVLYLKDQNFSAIFSTPAYTPWDEELITAETTLIATDIPSGAVTAAALLLEDNNTARQYYDSLGQEIDSEYFSTLEDTDINGNFYWKGYVTGAGGFLSYMNTGLAGFDAEPWDGGNTQSTPDYILMQRAAIDNNTWSRINFWHHKDRFIESTTSLPEKSYRAKRPILEFDRNLELHNFGTTGLTFTADLSGADYTKSEIQGRPISAPLDSQGLKVANKIILPDENSAISQYIYVIEDEQVQTVNGTVSNSITVVLDSMEDVYIGAIVKGTGISSTNTVVATADVDTLTITLSAAETIADGTALTFSNRIKLTRMAHPTTNPVGAIDGDANFVPWTPLTGDIVSVLFGNTHQGKEYYWSGTKWEVGQRKTKVNTAPLFKAYDSNKKALDNILTYPQSTFKGSPLFSYKTATTSTTNDSVLGFPIEYKNFNNFSEIVFDNNMSTDVISYTPFGATTTNFAKGYIYYKKTDTAGAITYNTAWRGHKDPFKQKVEDDYEVSQVHVDNSRTIWELTALPVDATKIRVKVNGIRRTDWTYNTALKAVQFTAFNLKKNDTIRITTSTVTGIIEDKNRHGRYELPLGWYANTNKADILSISEPQYLEHVKTYIEEQKDVTGDVLGSNNFANLNTDKKLANKIVQTDDDLLMAGFLVSNDSFNVVDAMKFNGDEYLKYKNRLKKEIKRYIDANDTTSMTDHAILEDVLQNVIAYNPGKLVFDYSYMLALGDRYDEELVVINNVIQKEYTLTNFLNLENIENTIHVYDQDSKGNDILLLIDKDYTITSTAGVSTLTFTTAYTLTLGSTIKIRFFNKNRESAQCPPTTAAMGITPVQLPKIMSDTSFAEAINVIVGHDGSRTVADNDKPDDILLEFEKRVYNSVQQVYRNKPAHPDLNVHDIRPGAFRTTDINRTAYYNILRENFNKFIARNEADFVENEYYDVDKPFTWNYNSGTTNAGYWRGIFEDCFDTARPHTHPWEMLGLVKKPSWWDTQYITATYTNYGSINKPMWRDIEDGIIRLGTAENVTNSAYKTNNPYRRIGLKSMLPVDADAKLLAPANISSTASTTKTISWTETETGTATANATSFIGTTDGLQLNERTDGTNTHINVTTSNILNHVVGTFPISNSTAFIEDKQSNYVITSNAKSNVATSYASATTTSNTHVGIAVNGGLIFNGNTGVAIDTTSNWHYNTMFRNDVGRDTAGGNPDSNNRYGYVQPSPQTVGLTEWSTSVHSPIVGWSFDGLPIYGPYGYTDRLNNSSDIKRLVSSYSLKTNPRDTYALGVGGNPTGEFIEDYVYDSATGDLDEFNGRYGVTPEFPTGTYYYVATISSTGTPVYPYTVAPKFRFAPTDLANNIIGAGTFATAGTENYALVNKQTVAYTIDTAMVGNEWKFGDGAPVENAWKMSEQYPFAIAEALFLTKPGKFASVFAEPEKIVRSLANPLQLLDGSTFKRYKVKDAIVHGSTAADNKTLLTNTGYTQFIDSYLRFNGINTKTEFATPFKSVNGKLGHKFAGFVDKDTMTVFSDSYSITGNSSSLILPHEDIQINVHVGPYTTTNQYTGVIIELTDSGYYKLSGYSSTKRFFEIETSNKEGQRTEVSVGGEAADFIVHNGAVQYNEGDIVKSGYNFFQAKSVVPIGTAVTDTGYYQRLSALPQINAAEATYYLEGTGVTQRVEYGTVYKTINEVFGFLIDLGRKQKAQGYDFNDYDNAINDVNDWLYSSKQFLFWSLGSWASGNTLSLSPMARKIKFTSVAGRISEIAESFKGQFSILDETGKKIAPTDCLIVRDGSTIEVTPPEASQIFGIIIHTNSIEHAMLINNKTVFGDTIYDNVFGHRQKRLKIKGKKTAGWTGSLMSEGFLITEDGLKPNYDTLAQDMGRYNEVGHVPVERQVYEASRRQYGYNERKYLREFELVDDNQFDFYNGMIRNKGTTSSIEMLLNSDKVLVPGSIAVYDEWALKSGEFGDIQNNQRIDIKVEDTEITSENQLIQVIYPEDVVSVISEIELLNATTKFYSVPVLEIEGPPAEIPGSFSYAGGTTAKALVNLNTNGTIKDITVTEPGYGYTTNPDVTVVAAQLLTANVTTYFSKPYAISSAYLDNSGVFTGNVLTGINLTDNFSANASSFIDLSSSSNITLVASAINSHANTNANVTATVLTITTSVDTNYMLQISGNDFTVGSSNDAQKDDLVNKLKLDNSANVILDTGSKRFQPRQRYSFESANTTTSSDIIVNINGSAVSESSNWEFDAGSRTIINPTERTTSGSLAFTFAPMSGTATTQATTTTGNIAVDNLQIINGNYPHIAVLVNGTLISDTLENDVTNGFKIDNVAGTDNAIITFYDVTKLPGSELNENTPITVIESATIDFTDTYQGDLPGSSLNIKVKANDALAAKLKQQRTLEITPDNKADSTILIDVDDSTRFIHRPTDMKSKDLWPTTKNVDFTGVTDSKYTPLPNAGYISSYNVGYQAMDLQDFTNLFDINERPASKIPTENDVVHFAISEHKEFDAYKLVAPTGSNVAYIKYNEQEGTSYLYTDISLNAFANANLVGNTLTAGNLIVGDSYSIVSAGTTDFTLVGAPDSTVGTTFTATGVGVGTGTADTEATRYYDNVIALKRDGIVMDDYFANIELADGEKLFDNTIMEVDSPVGYFLNEDQIIKNSITISGIGYKEPLRLFIEKIEPTVSGNISAVNYYVNTSETFALEANVSTNNTVKLKYTSTTSMNDFENGSYVTFTDASAGALNGNTYKTSNVVVSPSTLSTTLTGSTDTGIYSTTVNGALTSATTIAITAGDNAIQIGHVVSGTGIPADTKVTAITDAVTIIVDTAVTMANGAAIQFSRRTNDYSTANSIITTFTVTDASFSANVSASALSLSVNNGLVFTTDMDTTTVANLGVVKIKNAGYYSGVFRVVGKTANTISVYGDYVEPTSVTVSVGTTSGSTAATIATPNVLVTQGMLISGTGIPSGTTIEEITATGVTLSANATATGTASLTIQDNIFEDATIMTDAVDVTLKEAHALATDGSDTIVNKVVNIVEMEPNYYNWAWKVTSVPSTTTLRLEGFGYDHPYVTGGIRYISEKDYKIHGTDTLPTTGGDDSTAYLISKHDGDIMVNGAKVATAFPMHTSQEYADEINRQMAIKEGAIVQCDSFYMSLTGISSIIGPINPLSSLPLNIPFVSGVSLPNNILPNITTPNPIPPTQAQQTAINTLPNITNNITSSVPYGLYSHNHLLTHTTPKNYKGGGTGHGTNVFLQGGAGMGGSGKPNTSIGNVPVGPITPYVAPVVTQTGKLPGESWIDYHARMGTTTPAGGPVQPPQQGGGGIATPPQNPTPTVPPSWPIPTVVPPTTIIKGQTGGGSSVPTSGTTVVDWTPLLSITQHDDPCPPPPPVPPTPPVPPVTSVFVNEMNSQGRGVTETFKYTFASDTSQTYPVRILFDMYSAKDRMTIYQSTHSGSSGTKIAGTGVLSTLSNITQADINAWSGVKWQISSGMTNWQRNNMGAGASLLGQNYTSHGNGFVKENGKISFTYDASKGRYITITLDKDPSTSTAFKYFMEHPADDVNGAGYPSAGSVGVGSPPANGNQNNSFPNIPNQTQIHGYPTGWHGGKGIGLTSGFGHRGAGAIYGPSTPGQNYQPFGGNFGSQAVGTGGLGSFPSYQTQNYSTYPIGNVPQGTPTYRIQALALGGQPQSSSQMGSNVGLIKVASNTAGTSYLSITPLKKNSASGTVAPVSKTVHVPICTPKARVKICGQTKTVGQGDTFFINKDSITLSGATDLTAIKNEILSQTNTVDVFITIEAATKEKCLLIRNKLSDPMVIRNGCAGGVYKEVLDYSIKQDNQVCFNKETTLTPTTTGTGATKVTVTDPSQSNVSLWGTMDVAQHTTSYTTNTVTAEQNKQALVKNNICITAGTGYNVGDLVRVMGGTPVVSKGVSGIVKLTVNNPGTGYITDGIATPLTIKIGQRGEPGGGAEVKYEDITYDDNGGIVIDEIAKLTGILLEGSGYSIDNPPTITVIGQGSNAQISAQLDPAIAIERPAKFVITSVDGDGGIIDLQVIDRGIYKIFPSDLDSGVPIQYDIKRPIKDVTPEATLGSPDITFGTGTGGRVFLTAKDIPSCSENGNALTDLGLPEGVIGRATALGQLADDLTNYATLDPEGFPWWSANENKFGPDGRQLGGDDGLGDGGNTGAGSGSGGGGDTGVGGPGVGGPGGGGPGVKARFGELVMGGPNIDGLRLGDELNPGLLALLGITDGDYVCGTYPKFENIDSTGIDPKLDVTGAQLNNSNANASNLLGRGGGWQGNLPWTQGFNLGMGLGNASSIANLYEYELRQVDGLSPIQFTNDNLTRQDVKPLLLESMRYATESGLTLAGMSNVWIDNYDSNGWAYLESGAVIRKQESLTDIAFIDDVITYDADTAEKEFDINLYDPFKGIIPGFIDKDITFKTESDPVVYNTMYTKFGDEQVGQTWWDTSKVRYNWYEQGAGTYGQFAYNNQERNNNWGSKFPGSEIVIYEWTKNLVPPAEYAGEGTAIASQAFVSEQELNRKGKLINYYYYWIRGLTTIANEAMMKYSRSHSTQELEQLLDNPEGNRIPYFGLVSPDAMTINKLGDLIKTEDSIVSLNFRRKESGLSQKHTSWTLAGEGDSSASIPGSLSIKVIDSLAGYNAIDEVVPVSGLSDGERYGDQFRPRQTMFKDIKAARKQMFETMNEIFSELQMNTVFTDWRSGLPATTPHLKTTNWFKLLRTNKVKNTKVYYNEDYKPLRRVKTEKQLQLIKNLLDKSIIQVQNNTSSKYKLFEYTKSDNKFTLIAMENETVQWDKTVYTKKQQLEIGKEIRQVLHHLYTKVFIGSHKLYWNKLFFSMVKFAMGEQVELSWAFKSTYLNVQKEETDLIQFKGLKVDNFSKAVEYFNEVKPYSSKIRNYRDIKKAPVEVMKGTTSDFDRPAYFDEDTTSVRILDASVVADANILNTDPLYAGFVSSNAPIRQVSTKIVFDRVNADLFENSYRTRTQRVIATSDLTEVAFNFVPYITDASDVSSLTIKHNDVIVPNTTTSALQGAITNWTYNVADNKVIFNKAYTDNPSLGGIQAGDVLDFESVSGFNPSKETLKQSIAKNIVNIENANVTSLSSTDGRWRASDREFAFNTEIRTAFVHAMDSAHGVGAGSNTSITTDKTLMTTMVNDGNLDYTLSLVKTAIGGDFNGQMLDANTFIDVVPGTHPTTYYTNTRGLDFFLWDNDVWDKEVTVDNFHGVFDTDSQGAVNYRVNNETIYGFDAVTFTKSGYGPGRPQELIVVQPFETLVMNVYTSNVSYGNVAIGATSSKPVRHTVFVDLFGRTDYYRSSSTGLTTVTAIVNSWDTTITVADNSVLPNAAASNTGVIWINSERIEYTGIDSVNKKLLGIIRGTRGTTVNPSIAIGSKVYNGEETQNITLATYRDPQDLNWLADDGNVNYITTSLSDTSGGVDTNSIVGFIQDT